MYCILVTGIPASGKSTLSSYLSENLNIPVISKDLIKEKLFDTVGFNSRDEKVKLGIGAMEIMYYFAEQLMKQKETFILENNFENSSLEGLQKVLNQYSYEAITVTMTGDYRTIYNRFVERDKSPERHRGHVVNDCYPEKTKVDIAEQKPSMTYKVFVEKIEQRGMDTFTAGGPRIVVDTTDFQKVDMEAVKEQIKILTQ